jgi:hypothetical protein
MKFLLEFSWVATLKQTASRRLVNIGQLLLLPVTPTRLFVMIRKLLLNYKLMLAARLVISCRLTLKYSGAGSTFTGRSGMGLDVATRTSGTAALVRIIDFVDTPVTTLTFQQSVPSQSAKFNLSNTS